jgi:transposase InsO family protein
LELIDRAVADGWDHRRVCVYLELAEGRAWRWRERRLAGTLEDRPPGGHPVHAITPAEEQAILACLRPIRTRTARIASSRTAALTRVWCGCRNRRCGGCWPRTGCGSGRRGESVAQSASRSRSGPGYRRHSIWIYDTTRFAGCRDSFVVMIMDLVTRKWITEIVSGEETGLQVQLAFTHALELEGLLDQVDDHQRRLADPTVDDPERPVLLAVSDNGPQMTSGSTREFLAMCAIAQHFGRPGTPQDRAWIESLFSHVKADWPHLELIRDPAVLRAEPASVRPQYNTRRLHAGIGYVTPDDEHEGRGPAIRAARRAGLKRARRLRIAYHRAQRQAEAAA